MDVLTRQLGGQFTIENLRFARASQLHNADRNAVGNRIVVLVGDATLIAMDAADAIALAEALEALGRSRIRGASCQLLNSTEKEEPSAGGGRRGSDDDREENVS